MLTALLIQPVEVGAAADPPCAFDCTVPLSGTVGTAYEFSCVQGGNYSGNPTYGWTISGRPAGVDTGAWLEPTYHKGFQYKGTPTTASAYTISVTMTTSSPVKCTSVTKTYPVTIGSANIVNIDTATIPVGTELVPYTKDVLGHCTGGCADLYWTWGAIPAWLTITDVSPGLANATAILSGTPLQALQGPIIFH